LNVFHAAQWEDGRLLEADIAYTRLLRRDEERDMKTLISIRIAAAMSFALAAACAPAGKAPYVEAQSRAAARAS
jgi:hypothetical protein